MLSLRIGVLNISLILKEFYRMSEPSADDLAGRVVVLLVVLESSQEHKALHARGEMWT